MTRRAAVWREIARYLPVRSVVVDAARAAVDLLRWSPGWRGRVSALGALARYVVAPSGREPVRVLIRVGPAQFRVRPGRGEIGVVREVWRDRAYEAVPGFAAEPGWTVVDAGAHVGTYTVRQAFRAGPGGKVVAIEPNPEAFSQLEAHVTLNRLKNVVAVRQALAERSGTARFAVSVRAPMVSRFLHPWEPVPPDGWNAMEVPVMSLDDLCGRLRLERIDLLKIDVEHAETRVIAGAPMALARTRRLVVECLEDTRAMVLDQLGARGFAWLGDVGTVSYFARGAPHA